MELQVIQSKIYEIRGQKVMLDFDLAQLYNAETRRLKEQVKRNIQRFPSDFMFQLTKMSGWRLSQIAITYPKISNIARLHPMHLLRKEWRCYLEFYGHLSLYHRLKINRVVRLGL